MASLRNLLLAVSGLLASALASSSAGDGLPYAFPSSSTPVPFKISVNRSFVRNTVDKVKQYRPVHGVYPTWTNEGPNEGTITQLADYWAKEYDWYAVQDELNANLSQYATTVAGGRDYQHPVQLHFVHQRSSRAGATPLLLLHGWPSTLLEWRDAVPLLTAPTTKVDPAFHVVAPDFPGFGFSPAPQFPGMGPREAAVVFDQLMKQLGYDRYGIVTTDLGWFVGNWMVKDLDNIRGHFTDFYLVTPADDDLARYGANKTTQEETNYIASLLEFNTNHSAYRDVHSQKPLALALAMADSPVGFAGWMWDLIYLASDGYKYSLSTIITDAFLLYIPGVYSNIRFYLEFFKPDVAAPPKTSVPTGVTQWPSPNGPFKALQYFPLAPRTWVERTANVTYFSRHDGGGHFPAISRTKQWTSDVRKFFATTK